MAAKSDPFAAIAAGSRERLELALDAGSDVNAAVGEYTRLGNTALHRTQTTRSMTVLLARGADVNLMNAAGFTPLMNAADVMIAQMLIAHGACVDAQSPH